MTQARLTLPGARMLVRLGWLGAALLLLLIAALPAAAVEQLHILSRWPGDLPEHYYFDGVQSQGWNVIGGKTIVSPPALVSYAGQVQLLAVAGDQTLYQATWNGATWTGWFNLGGPFDAAGAAAVDYFGYLILLAVAPDHNLYLAYFDPNANKWNGYFLLTQNVYGRPAATIHNGQLHVFVKGGDDHYYQRYWDGQQWNGWFDRGGPFGFGPAVTSFQGQLQLFGPGYDGKLYQGYFDGSQWLGFFNQGAPVGTVIEGSAAATTYAGNLAVVAVRGADGGLYVKLFGAGAGPNYLGSLGQTVTGPGVTNHVVGGPGGPGGGPNHPPTFSSLVATRTALSFGRDPEFRGDGLASRPGFAAIEPLVAPRIIALDSNADGKLDGLDPIVVAAGNLPSCCTLLVAEGASDPDGNAINFHWQAVEGTFYSTGSDGAGGFPFGAKITDISVYNRNSVFWEAPSMIPSPIVDEQLAGGLTNVGVQLTDVPSAGQPLASDVKFAALEYDRSIHLEIVFLSSLRLPANDPNRPNGIVMKYFASLKGSFEVSMPVTFRIDCGANRTIIGQTRFDQPLTSGATFDCPYDKDEEDSSRTVTVVASVGSAGAPFAFPIDTTGLNVFRSLGCAAGDTESQQVKANQVTNNLLIDLFDNGAALDDAFDLIVDGSNLGRTPPGGDKLFDVSYLTSGQHQACVNVVLAPDDVGTFQIGLSGGVNGVLMTFEGGGTTRTGSPSQGTSTCFNFTVP